MPSNSCCGIPLPPQLNFEMHGTGTNGWQCQGINQTARLEGGGGSFYTASKPGLLVQFECTGVSTGHPLGDRPIGWLRVVIMSPGPCFEDIIVQGIGAAGSCSPAFVWQHAADVEGDCCDLGQPSTVQFNVWDGVPVTDSEPPRKADPCMVLPPPERECCWAKCGGQCSPGPVLYATGELQYVARDLVSDGYGASWGHTRSFANRISPTTTIGNGFNWLVNQWSYLVIKPWTGDASIQGRSLSSLWFRKTEMGFEGEFGIRQTLVVDTETHRYVLTDLDGSVTEFDAVTGVFRAQIDPAGNRVEVVSLASNGSNLGEVQRQYTQPGVTITESYSYEYGTATGAHLLSMLTLRRRQNAGPWMNNLRATYQYYGTGESYGAEGDLKTVVTEEWNGWSWVETGTTGYRYYASYGSSSSSSSSGSGFFIPAPPHLLKYVLNPAAYARMVADGHNPLLVSDAVYAQYADYYFEYDDQRRVTLERLEGGTKTFTFAYEESAFPDGENNWKTKTTETLPDGTQNVVFSNAAGLKMLTAHTAGGKDFFDFYKYDDSRVVLHASPQAISGYDETKADLLDAVNGNYTYLKDNLGLIRTFSYHSPSGRISAEMIQRGELGCPIKLHEYEYIPCACDGASSSSSAVSSSSGSSTASLSSSGGATSSSSSRASSSSSASLSSSSSAASSSSSAATPIDFRLWFLSREIAYPEDGNCENCSSSSSGCSGCQNDGTRTIITDYSYTWYSGTCAVKEKVTTLPAIPASQNGSGIRATRREYFDTYGNRTWQKDERGVLVHFTYDIPTGAVTQRIDDVDTSLVSDAPAGWYTPPGAGLHLITDFEHDDRGRVTQSLGPVHTSEIDGFAVSVRTAAWTVYEESAAANITRTARGYEVQSGASSSSSTSQSSGSLSNPGQYLVNPVTISVAAKNGKLLEQIQAVRGGTATSAPVVSPGRLLSSDSFSQSQYVRWTTHQYVDGDVIGSTRVYHAIPASGVGTLNVNYSQTTFGYDDMLRRDTVTDGLGDISRTVFDGRGLVSAEISPSSARTTFLHDLVGAPVATISPVGARTTTIYDFRNRAVATLDPMGSRSTTLYDNLDREVQKTDPLGGNFVTRPDDLGRVYRKLDPLAARTSFVYDIAGKQIAQIDPLGARTSSVYDHLGRGVATIDPRGNRTTILYNRTGAAVAIFDSLLHRTTTAYDAIGRQITTTGPLGATSRVRYASSGDVMANIDASGSRSTMVYDASGRMRVTVGGGGRRTTTIYDAASRPIVTISPLGARTTSLFGADGHNLATINPRGFRTTNVRDVGGRLIARRNPVGHRTSFVLDPVGRVVAVVNPLGLRTTSSYDVAGRVRRTMNPAGEVSTLAYDPIGRIVAKVNPLGNRTTHVFNLRGQEIADINPMGFRTTRVYDIGALNIRTIDPLGRITTNVYDIAGRAVATINPENRRTTSTYDAAGRRVSLLNAIGAVTATAYDSAGRVVRGIDPVGATSTTLYDSDGRVLANIDALGARTSNIYDAGGRRIRSINPLGFISTVLYDVGDLAIAQIDPLGGRTTNTFDAESRRIAVLDPLGRRTTTVFDAAGRQIASVNALGQRTTTIFDAADRALATVNTGGFRTTVAYDAAGRERRRTNPENELTSLVYNAAGWQIASINSLAARTTTVYDATGRLIASRDPLGNRNTMSYDAVGRRTRVLDPLSRATTTVYDAVGRPKVVIDPLGHRTTTIYDLAGQAIRRVDPLGAIATSVYDKRGRVIRSISPVGAVTSTVYDAAGQSVVSINPLGARTTTVYDPAGRAIRSVDPRGDTTTSLFDAAGQMQVRIDPLGRRTTTIHDAAGRQVATLDPLQRRATSLYDAAGRLMAKMNPLGARETTLFDRADRPVARVNPNGNRTTTVYDAVGRQRRTVNPLSEIATLVYNQAGWQVASIDATNVRTTNLYNTAGQIVATRDALNYRNTTTYDAAGRITRRTNPLGRMTTTVYDAANRQIASVDPLARRTSTSYDAAGRAIRTVAPDGAITTTLFDLSGQRKRKVNPVGGIVTTLYDAAGHPVVSIDPLGGRTTTAWDAAGRERRVTNPLGHLTTSVHDAAGQLIAKLDPLGHRTSTVFDTAGRQIATVDALARRSTTTLDPAARRISEIDPLGLRTTTVYDNADRPVARINPLGFRTTTAYDKAGRAIRQTNPRLESTTTVYNPLGWQVATVDPAGARTTNLYDAAGRAIATVNPVGSRTTTVRDAAGQATRKLDPLGRITTTVYDIAGRQVATVDPLGRRASTVYDKAGRTRRTVNGAGAITTLAWDVAGRQIRSTNPLNSVTTTLYDAAGRTVAAIDPLGQRNTSVWDAAGRQVRTVNPLSEIATTHYDAAGQTSTRIDPLGKRTTSVYDGDGRLLATIDPLGRRTTSAYDVGGRQIAEVNPRGKRTTTVFDQADRPISRIDPLGNRTTTLFDLAGRSAVQLTPSGARTTNTWNPAGWLRRTVDPDTRISSFAYDATGRQIAKVNALGHRLTTLFDATGQSVALVDALTHRVTFAYDAAGRESVRINPLLQRKTTTYDAAGQTRTRIDARGNRTTYIYDAAGRRTARLYPDATRITWVYDALGQPRIIDSAAGRFTRTFESNHHIRQLLWPNGYALTFTFDAAGQRHIRRDSDGTRTTYAYDAAGKLARLDDDGGRTTLSYDDAGREVLQELPNGASVSTIYDTEGRATRAVNIHSGTPIASFRYRYTPGGQRSDVIESDGSRVSWTYDAAGQLRGEHRTGTSPVRATFVYDAVGNRLVHADADGRTTSVYDVSNRLHYSVDPLNERTTYSYDADGNRRSVETPAGDRTTFTWTAENQLGAVELPTDELVTYAYAPVNRNSDELRVARHSDDGTTCYVWDNKNIVRETDDLGAVEAAFTIDPQPHGHLIAQNRDGERSFFHFDAEGSTVALTDETGAVTDEYVYTAFGETLSASGTTENPFQWVGRLGYYREEDTGLHSLRRRQYESTTGRFLSEDPIAYEAGDENLYRYTSNDPANRVDPSGLECKKPGSEMKEVQVCCPRLGGLWWDRCETMTFGPVDSTGFFLEVPPGSGSCSRGNVSVQQLEAAAKSLEKSCVRKDFCKSGSTTTLDEIRQKILDAACSNSTLPPCDKCEEPGWLMQVIIKGVCIGIESGLNAPGFCDDLQKCKQAFGTIGEILECLPCDLAETEAAAQCLSDAFQQAASDLINKPEDFEQIKQELFKAIGQFFGIDLQGLVNLDLLSILKTFGINGEQMLCCALEGVGDACPDPRLKKLINFVIPILVDVISSGGANVTSAVDRLKQIGLNLTVDDIWKGVKEQIMEFVKSEVARMIGDMIAGVLKELVGGAALKIFNLIRDLVKQCGTVNCVLTLIAKALCAAVKNCDRSTLISLIKCLIKQMIGPLIQMLLSAIGAGSIGQAIRDFRNRIETQICMTIKSWVYRILGGICKGQFGKPEDCICRLPKDASGNTIPKPSNCVPGPGSQPAGSLPSACSLASCNCFPAGTLVAVSGVCVPIESLRLGQRVTAFTNAERRRFGAPPELPVDPEAWRVVRLRLDHGHDYAVEVDLLRGLDWLGYVEPKVGERIFLNQPEMGAEGDAEVLDISPCPPLDSGAGRLITGLYRHTCGTPHSLHIEGQDKPLRPTSLHPFWCENKDGWIAAQDLEEGDQLLREDGTLAEVLSNGAGIKEERVYNLEVDIDHCYRVSEQRLLVHNASAMWEPVQIYDSSSPKFEYVTAAAEYRGNSSDLALRVGKRNLGRVKYKTKDGVEKWYRPRTFVVGRAGFGQHAEAQIQLYLEQQIDDGYGCGLVVLELFTERYPCDVCSSQFLSKLADDTGVSYKVYWFAPHGENFDDDPGGKQLRDEYMRVSLYPWPI